MSKPIKFGIELNNNKLAKEFIADVKKNITIPNFARNPFKGTIREEIIKENYNVYFDIISLYPNPLIFIIISYLIVLFISGFKINGWLIIPILLTFTLFVRTKYFFYSVMTKGLNKKGYYGKIKLIGFKDGSKRVI